MVFEHTRPAAQPLTVVQVLPALESGGVERGTLEVGKFLAERGHRSIVMSSGGRLVDQLVREGSEHQTWDIGRKSLWSLRLIPRLRQFLLDNRVDILHVRSRMPAWVCYLAWRGMKPDRRPHFVTTVHGLYSVNAYSAIMTRGETVIAVSNTVRDYLVNHYPDIDPERIRVIPRGVDRSIYTYQYQPPADWLSAWQRDFPELAGKRVLLLPGRITRLKGHEDFCHLIAQLRDEGLPVQGLVVGGASPRKRAYYEEIQQLAEQLGLRDKLSFAGQRADLREIMASVDIVLSLSSQPESFGRTVLESLSLGVPVIGYDHGGVGEQLETLLPAGRIPLGDLTALANRIKDWLQQPPAIPANHAFSLENMLEATLAAYQGLIANRQQTDVA